MKLFILKTGLFPEKVTIEEAITGLTSSHEISYFDTERPALTDEDWDKAAQEIVAADRVLTL
jgi:hypothetical protein